MISKTESQSIMKWNICDPSAGAAFLNKYFWSVLKSDFFLPKKSADIDHEKLKL